MIRSGFPGYPQQIAVDAAPLGEETGNRADAFGPGYYPDFVGILLDSLTA